MHPVVECRTPNRAGFAEIRTRCEPVVMRNLVSTWPVVAAAQTGNVRDYLLARATAQKIPMLRAHARERGRLHYTAAFDRSNFDREMVSIAEFLAEIDRNAEALAQDTLAIQSIPVEQILPGFRAVNPMPLLDAEVEPRIWLGTAAIVATHHDQMENIACVAAGRRRFTLFAPEQVANLYMGPFHLTPAGAAVSMVHLTQPDLARYPRFAKALAEARTAELDPGDAIYIPYGWYHHVEALSPLNVLVNYWWNPARRDVGSPWDALMHGMVALRQLPPDQRRSWRAMFDHYVFKTSGDPAEHLPEAMRGILGADTQDDLASMRRSIIAALQRFDPGSR